MFHPVGRCGLAAQKPSPQSPKRARCPHSRLKKRLFNNQAFNNGPLGQRSLPEEATSSFSSTSMFDVGRSMFDVPSPSNQ
jgi:hypothetical protein